MEISGKWLFKELDNIEYQGILYLTNNSIKLVVEDMPINTFVYPVRFSIVTGKTIDGLFTLVDVVYRGNFRHNNKTKLSHKTLYPNEILRGKLFESQSELSFRTFKFEIDGLKEWFNLKNIEEKEENSILKITYTKPKSTRFILRNLGTISFDFEESSFFEKDEYNTIYQLKQFVTTSLIALQDDDYKSSLALMKKIVQFFCLIFGKETHVHRQYFFDEINNRDLIFFSDSKDIEYQFNDRIQFSITYSDIKNQFDEILNNFLSLYESLSPTLNIWINFLINDKLNYDNSFILTCQALEAWHRRFFEENESYQSGEFNSYNGRRSPKFKTRIKKLLEYSESNFGKNIFESEGMDYSDISEKITKTRDHFTHFIVNSTLTD